MMKKTFEILDGNYLTSKFFIRALCVTALSGSALLGLSSCTLFQASTQGENTQQPSQNQKIASQVKDLENLLNCKSSHAEYAAFKAKVGNQTRITLENGMTLTHYQNELSDIAKAHNLPDYRIYDISQPITVEAGFPAQFFRKPPPGTPKVEQPPRKPETFVSSRIGVGQNRVVAYINENPSQVFYSLDADRVNTKRLPYFVEAYKVVKSDAGDTHKKRHASSQPDAGKSSLLGCEYSK